MFILSVHQGLFLADFIAAIRLYFQELNRVGVIKIVIVINCNLITFSKVIACNCN